MNREKKEWMKNRIDEMSVSQHNQIYKIITEETKNYTTTQNGIFISTDVLSNETLERIEKYIVFCIEQAKILDNDMVIRKTFEQLLNK